MNYQVTLNSVQSISIMRVENGWLIRTSDEYGGLHVTPLKVAETPKALGAIIDSWAAASAAMKSGS